VDFLEAMLIRLLNRRDALLPADSLQALDRLDFFLAALLMGFGPFVTVYLAGRGWVPESIGFVLTASGLAGLLTQVPGGELIDAVKAKRAVVGAATAAVILVILVYRLLPDFPAVFAAAMIQGAAGSLLGPGIAAISLGLVGHEALGERLGRNQRFASIGGLTAAGIMGIVGGRYRLVVAIRYSSGVVFIRFVGTHSDYDKIDTERV
jgi:predicted MFS family arabinose efflux permease